MYSTVSEVNFNAMQLLLRRSHRLTGEAKAKELERMAAAWREGRLSIAGNADPRYFWALCAARLMLGDYSDWSGWEFRTKWATRAWYRNPFRFPLWDGKPTGKLLLIGEQGIGDEVLFASAIPDAIAACGADRVLIETGARLVPAFRRSFGADVRAVEWVERDGEMVRSNDFSRSDATAWLPTGDLWRIFRHHAADFPGTPFLKPDPERVVEFERYRGWTGVSWRGNNGNYPWRTFEGKRVVSLQYGQQPDEAIPSPGIDLRDDLEGILALVSVLGRVVSVSTAAAHLACALGVETHVVLAPAISTGIPDDRLNWRWGLADRVPWYTSARVHQDLDAWWESDAAQLLWSEG